MLELITITPTRSRPIHLWHKDGKRYSRHFYSIRSANAWLAHRRLRTKDSRL
jgi:hypothetical protein